MNKLCIKITHSAKSLSSFSGLLLFSDLISKFELQSVVAPFLPKKQRDRGFSSFQKFYSGILGFVAGAECIDDFDSLAKDPFFFELTGSPSSITIGNFLRSFLSISLFQIFPFHKLSWSNLKSSNISIMKT